MNTPNTVTKTNVQQGLKNKSKDSSLKPSFRERTKTFWKPTGLYIKLQTKLSFTPNKTTTIAKKIIRYALDAIIFAFFLFIIFVFSRDLTQQTTFVKGQDTTIVFFTIAQLAILIASIAMQIKRLYKPTDLRIILTFPLTPLQRYIGEIIAIYIKISILSFALFYPFLLVFGGATKLLSVGYIFLALVSTILMPLLPFALSLVISVPFMYLSNYLSNKNVVKLILFILLFTAILIAYGIILNFMSDFFVHAKTTKEINEAIARFLKGMNQWYNPFAYVNVICIAQYINSPAIIGGSIGIFLAFILAFGSLGIFITKTLYYKFTSSPNALEGDGSIKNIKSKFNSPYGSMFIQQLKQIIRTPAYAYFYLGVAITMPVMTYLLNDIIMKVGQAEVGSTAFFGFGLLILCIIVSLVGSFAATAISREGKQLYITKMVPLGYRKQLLTKGSINFMVSFIGMLLCFIVMGTTAMKSEANPSGLDVPSFWMLCAIVTVFLAGITFNGMNLNLARPKYDVVNGQTSESNVVLQLIIGIIITTIISIVAIITPALAKNSMLVVQGIILGSVALYAGINILIFFLTAEKKYRNIEVK